MIEQKSSESSDNVNQKGKTPYNVLQERVIQLEDKVKGLQQSNYQLNELLSEREKEQQLLTKNLGNYSIVVKSNISDFFVLIKFKIISLINIQLFLNIYNVSELQKRKSVCQMMMEIKNLIENKQTLYQMYQNEQQLVKLIIYQQKKDQQQILILQNNQYEKQFEQLQDSMVNLLQIDQEENKIKFREQLPQIDIQLNSPYEFKRNIASCLERLQAEIYKQFHQIELEYKKDNQNQYFDKRNEQVLFLNQIFNIHLRLKLQNIDISFKYEFRDVCILE